MATKNKALAFIGRFIRTLPRKLLLLCLDAAVCAACAYLAVLLRFAPLNTAGRYEEITRYLWLFIVPYLVSFAVFGMYNVLWRYAESWQILLQTLASGVGGTFIIVYNLTNALSLSRYMTAIQAALIAIVIGCARLSARAMREHALRLRGARQDGASSGRRVLIVGAGMGGSYAVTLCRRHQSAMGKPVALVDDARLKQGMRVQGVPVLGAIEDIPRIAESMRVTDLLIAMPSQRGERMRQIISLCNATKLQVRVLSDPEKLPDEKISPERLTLRKPNIADFLSRDEVKTDTAAVAAYVRDRVVMVTGGGGSIGSEICRQLMAFSPKLLIVFDIYENCAYELQTELKQKYGADCPVLVLIGSVRDKRRLREVMQAYRPHVIFHAAAHKHVPLMEDSPAEAVKNNIFGTMNVLEAAGAAGVERFVQISTDKAVNPTNVMGATKRVTEMLTQYYARRLSMQCMAVRFGNVLGSHGSVIPLFESQIEAGGPVTVTHPDITRYFMTIPEAAQLVIQAGANADTGCIYVLDMGQPVRIMDLAVKLIRFYGLTPGEDIQIKVTGLRPGEKLYEELLMSGESGQIKRTAHDKIMVAPSIDMNDEEFMRRLQALSDMVFEPDGARDIDALLDMLHTLVPTFKHEHLLKKQAAG